MPRRMVGRERLGGGGDHRDAAAPQGQGLASGPASSRLLVKERSEGLILLPDTGNHCRICHNGIIVRRCSFEKLFWNSSQRPAIPPRRQPVALPGSLEIAGPPHQNRWTGTNG